METLIKRNLIARVGLGGPMIPLFDFKNDILGVRGDEKKYLQGLLLINLLQMNLPAISSAPCVQLCSLGKSRQHTNPKSPNSEP